jgi:hypothetical protein
MTDAFDCPFPKRETNWTLPKSDRRALHLDRPTNRTDDIPGATPGTTIYFQARRFTHKPNLFATSDIEGASPARQVPEVVRRAPGESSYLTETGTVKSDSRHSTRTSDPLNPTYALPLVKHRLPTPQKQIRETLKLSDIQGTKPKAFYVRSSIRNTLDSSDIPHSTAGDHLKRLRTSGSLALVNADIMSGPETKLPPRNTNPLVPEYKLFSATTGHDAVIGYIAGAHPKPARSARKDNILSSLRSDDIDGASCGNSMPYPKIRKNLGPTRWTSTGTA